MVKAQADLQSVVVAPTMTVPVPVSWVGDWGARAPQVPPCAVLQTGQDHALSRTCSRRDCCNHQAWLMPMRYAANSACSRPRPDLPTRSEDQRETSAAATLKQTTASGGIRQRSRSKKPTSAIATSDPPRMALVQIGS